MGTETVIVEKELWCGFVLTKKCGELFWYWLHNNDVCSRDTRMAPITREHLLGLLKRDERLADSVREEAMEWVVALPPDSRFALCGFTTAVSSGVSFYGDDDREYE
jgi:hypothetical protein